MEQPESTSAPEAAVAETTADAALSSDQSESGASGDEHAASLNESMDSFIRGVAGRPSSKPDDAEQSGASDPSGDSSKPGGSVRGPDGKFISGGRRSRGAMSDQERIADLERQIAERDPQKIREQIANEERQQREAAAAAAYDVDYLGDETAYQAALKMPDSDPALNGPAPNGSNQTLYMWREERKERRLQHPNVEKHYQSVADQRLTQAAQAHESVLRSQLSRHVALPGVDPDTFRQLRDWGAIGDELHAAGGRARQHEIDQRDERIRDLELTVSDLKRTGPRGLGSVRVPAAGRSGPGAPQNDMEAWIRGVATRRG